MSSSRPPLAERKVAQSNTHSPCVSPSPPTHTPLVCPLLLQHTLPLCVPFSSKGRGVGYRALLRFLKLSFSSYVLCCFDEVAISNSFGLGQQQSCNVSHTLPLPLPSYTLPHTTTHSPRPPTLPTHMHTWMFQGLEAAV